MLQVCLKCIKYLKCYEKIIKEHDTIKNNTQQIRRKQNRNFRNEKYYIEHKNSASRLNRRTDRGEQRNSKLADSSKEANQNVAEKIKRWKIRTKVRDLENRITGFNTHLNDIKVKEQEEWIKGKIRRNHEIEFSKMIKLRIIYS